MFARVKKSDKYQYLQIVENSRIDGKVRQRVIATVGRLDQLQATGDVETLIRSLARFRRKPYLFSPVKWMFPPMPSKLARH